MIYLAGPLFTEAERHFNRELAKKLEETLNKEIFLPQLECGKHDTPEKIFSSCIDGINNSEIIIAILDGADSDSGTSFEAGYAFAKGIPIIGIRTDFRQCGDDGGLNLMLSRSCKEILHISSLKESSIIEKICNFIKNRIDEI